MADEYPLWETGMKVSAGGRYLLPRKTEVPTIVVDQPDVRFYSGWVWNPAGSVFSVKGGGVGFRAIGVRFDLPDAPRTGKKIPGMGTCVLTVAAETLVIACTFGSVNECVRAMPGSSALAVIWCDDLRGDIRSAWVYLAGCKGARILGNTFRDSATENGIRTSPENGQISEDVLIAYNDLTNPGPSKHVIDARFVTGVKIQHNRIRKDDGSKPAVRLGDSAEPGCVDAMVEDNDFDMGHLHGKAVSSGIVRNNRFWGIDPLKVNPLNFDAASAVVRTGNIAYTVGPVPAKAKKLGGDNRWEPEP